MKFVDVKNKKGTALTLGINPVGLNVYRLGDTTGEPVVKFGWAECTSALHAGRSTRGSQIFFILTCAQY